VAEFAGYRLTLHGSIAPSSAPDFVITFDRVFFMSLPLEWKTDTSREVVGVLTGASAEEVNLRFRVEQGNTLFSFRPENYPDDFRCLIGARSVSWCGKEPEKDR
jgi:hypothetical protein